MHHLRFKGFCSTVLLITAAAMATQCASNPSPPSPQSAQEPQAAQPEPPSTQSSSIRWIDVPGTAIASEINPDSNPAQVGQNTWMQRGNQRVFDAIVDNQYVWYVGNCETNMLYRLALGRLNQNRQPESVEPYPNEQWFEANEFQSKILNQACSL